MDLIGRWYDPGANVHFNVLGVDLHEGRVFYILEESGDYQEVDLVTFEGAVQDFLERVEE